MRSFSPGYCVQLTCTESITKGIHTWNTLFILIVAAANINFSLAWVQLLIKCSSYSRAAYINFGPIPQCHLQNL